MDKTRGPWDEGQQAWSRLEGWYQDAALPPPGGQEAGQRALRALEDSGLVRRLLDQVEFEAVRNARRDGKSWAEIAVKLGVTRQSAWERWRDVDDSTSARPGEPEREDEYDEANPGGMLRRKSPGSVTASSSAAETPERAAREWRRRSTVNVPNVIGMSYEVARKVIYEKGLYAASPDPDGPPLGSFGWPDGAVVVDQTPESGAKVPRGSAVRLWVERGGGDGGSGVREPRRPRPDPKSGQRMRDEATDETVSSPATSE